MKFIRQKPNASHWRSHRSQRPKQPVAETFAGIGNEIDTRIQEAFEGKMDVFTRAQARLDAMCACNGHRFDQNTDHGETCVICGHSLSDIKAGLGIDLSTAMKHARLNGDGTYTHIFVVEPES